ncbi:hypothetical protein D3C83_82620 [compost metagenome]
MVGFLQPLEFLKMLVVKDRTDQPTELAEFIARRSRRELRFTRESIHDVPLSYGDKTLASFGFDRIGRHAQHLPVPIISEARGVANVRAVRRSSGTR